MTYPERALPPPPAGRVDRECGTATLVWGRGRSGREGDARDGAMRGQREGEMGGFRRRAEGKSTRRETLNVLSKAN